jgi:thiol:disulfide interchange protein DsbD
MGLGTILVAVGTFTGALKILPRSGVWLQRIKIISGLLILALAEYFVFKAGTLR